MPLIDTMANATIHSTAIIDEGAQVGGNSRIWYWVHVCAGACIGKWVSFGQNVYVGNKVVIGDTLLWNMVTKREATE